MILLLCFFAFLHCWLNLFGELLRFADRMFYKVCDTWFPATPQLLGKNYWPICFLLQVGKKQTDGQLNWSSRVEIPPNTSQTCFIDSCRRCGFPSYNLFLHILLRQFSYVCTSLNILTAFHTDICECGKTWGSTEGRNFLEKFVPQITQSTFMSLSCMQTSKSSFVQLSNTKVA